ncbi:MAG: 3-dehydroquinate synthase [Oscillospiraceae bacterium]|nr:3-dehydroquinate synthase [Oscillospiraceae bacterium]
MTSITIRSARPYDVLIAPGLLDRAGELLRPLVKTDRAALICGDHVYPLYAGRAVRALERAGFHVCVKTIPHGERHKNLDTYGEILSFLWNSELGRDDPIVSLGGGVTGDLSGFAAASYQRGCPFVQIPTTLLAAIDASVGGKTAIDLPGGKNQAGFFYSPLAVLCDPELFGTLPVRELRCGLAEAVKTGVLFDRALFDSLRGGWDLSLAGELVARCVAHKRDVVERDEFDRGERQLLNLGHSFGHAIEQRSGYSLSHGEAVAIGMAMIARAAVGRGFCDAGTAEEIVSLLRTLGLPTDCPYPAAELLEIMKHDKKRRADTLRLVVPRAVGRCELIEVPLAELGGWLRDGGAR